MIFRSSSILLIVSLFIACNPSENTIDITHDTLFRLVDNQENGISFRNDVKIDNDLNAFTYKYVYNGGGTASADLDNDGLAELIFTSNQNGIELYHNQGDLQFSKVKDSGLVSDNQWLTGITICDVNQDGLNDIYVCASGPFDTSKNHLFINKGGLTFEDQAESYGIADHGYSTQAVFADFDKDGDDDLYVSNHPIDFNANMDFYIEKSKNPGTRDQDRLYRNDGQQFVDVTASAGLVNYGFSLSASVADLNDDGWLDIYVANDFHTPDYYFVNQGGLRFEDQLKSTFAHTSNFSMGTDAADINNDGLLDLIELDMVSADPKRAKTQMPSMNPEAFWFTVDFGYHYQYMTNVLQLNNGNGRFSDIAKIAGIGSTDWSWGPIIADLDADGNKDIFISNGIRKDVNDQDFNRSLAIKQSMGLNTDYALANAQMPEAPIPNYAFKNKGDLTFENQSKDWGLDFEGFSTSTVINDLDNDGDLDIVMNNIDTLALVFENTASSKDGFNYISINTLNKNGKVNDPGNKIKLWSGGSCQVIEQTNNRGFQSSCKSPATIAYTQANYDSIEVYWHQTNTTSTIRQLEHSNYTIKQENDRSISKIKQPTLFVNTASSKLQFQRIEDEVDDFDIQVLLPHELSNWEYAMAKGDINGDGREDLFLGGAADQSSQIYVQRPNGQFVKSQQSNLLNDIKCEDSAAQFADINNDGHMDLFVVSGGYGNRDNEAYRDRLYLNNGSGQFTEAIYTPNTATGGSVAIGDLDNDGTKEIIVGARFDAYPKSSTSHVYQLNNGELQLHGDSFINGSAENNWNDIIIVDIDNDADPDIITAGEWESIEVHINDNGQFKSNKIPDSEGWWFELNSGDFNNDGYVDFVAGNLGLNYKYKAAPDAPFTVYHGNLDNNSSYDIVLSYHYNGELRPLRGKECSTEQLPLLSRKFKSYKSFSETTVNDMLGEEILAKAKTKIARTFASVLLLNDQKGGFSMQALPNEAQISAIRSSAILDVDQDGHQDIIVAGNIYTSEVETPRADASIGLLLKGKGDGSFEAVPAIKSGIKLEGEIKEMLTINGSNGIEILAANPNKIYSISKIN